MTTLCLIHSSGQGPEGWKLVARELERLGHSVITPALDLSRLNEGLVDHAETVAPPMRQSYTTLTDLPPRPHLNLARFMHRKCYGWI
jgi:hypothetical protein